MTVYFNEGYCNEEEYEIDSFVYSSDDFELEVLNYFKNTLKYDTEDKIKSYIDKELREEKQKIRDTVCSILLNQIAWSGSESGIPRELVKSIVAIWKLYIESKIDRQKFLTNDYCEHLMSVKLEFENGLLDEDTYDERCDFIQNQREKDENYMMCHNFQNSIGGFDYKDWYEETLLHIVCLPEGQYYM